LVKNAQQGRKRLCRSHVPTPKAKALARFFPAQKASFRAVDEAVSHFRSLSSLFAGLGMIPANGEGKAEKHRSVGRLAIVVLQQGNGSMTHRVLLTDADTILLSMYRTFLTEQRFTVRTASSGLECMELLRKWRPDVLVLDSHLPWGAGLGVLALMREDPDVPVVPVLLLTTDPALTAEVPGLDHAVLLKPVPVLVLAQAIHRLTRSGPADGDDHARDDRFTFDPRLGGPATPLRDNN
jgi:CheY-like chemotaxis protein